MSDPWEQQAATGSDQAAYRPAYAAPPRRDNTPYVILIGVGCAFALAVVIYAISTSRPAGDAGESLPPAPVRAARQAPAQELPQARAGRNPAGSPGAVQGPARPMTMPARPPRGQEEAWTIEKAVQVSGAIDEQGRLRITARNLSPGRIRYVNVEVRTSDRENANRTATLSDIGPGQETTVVVDYPELRRRDDPRAVPEMYVWEGEFDTAQQAPRGR